MPDFFRGVFDTDLTQVISITDFSLCVGGALVAGLLLALAYMVGTRYTKSFVATLALLPAVVCVIIMMVNGSVPGSAKEIGAIFLAMGTGLVMGMGYIGYGFVIAMMLGGVSVLYHLVNFGSGKKSACYKTLHITIPEDLDYTGVFDDLLQRYTNRCELSQVKTTNMGSLLRLTYQLTLRDPKLEKEFIDQLRCRNGNLEITVSRQETASCEL